MKFGNLLDKSASKSPRLGRYACHIYQKCWNVVDKTVYSAIRTFLHHEQLLKEIDNTYIILIPKKGKSN